MEAEKPSIQKMVDKDGSEYGIVVMLDALGMRDIWKSKDPETVLRLYKLLTDVAEKKIVEDGRKYGIEFEIRVFSDTVLITGTCGYMEPLLLETPPIINTFTLLGMVMGFYFRGCIGIGEYFPSEKLVIGPAISEAAEFYDKMEMVGVFVNPSLQNILIEKMSNNDEFKKYLNIYYTEYDVPLDGDTKRKWLMKHFPNTDISAIGIPSEKLGATTLLDFVKRKITQFKDDPKIKNKWQNTLAFLEHTK